MYPRIPTTLTWRGIEINGSQSHLFFKSIISVSRADTYGEALDWFVEQCQTESNGFLSGLLDMSDHAISAWRRRLKLPPSPFTYGTRDGHHEKDELVVCIDAQRKARNRLAANNEGCSRANCPRFEDCQRNIMDARGRVHAQVACEKILLFEIAEDKRIRFLEPLRQAA